jgi:mono/diheme cytochrome c family protein
MRTRGIIAVIIVLLVVAAIFAWKIFGPGPMAFSGGSTVALADYHAADPTGVPADLANADIVKRGEYLTRAADCMVCHTAPDGAEYAGGLGFPMPFGTLYSTNITPDKETGIGNYSDQDFLNAVQRGVRPDGTHLYPAMPFTSYTYITDNDALAIKAYLFSLPAVHTAAVDNTLGFPFDQRWLMGFWSAFFNENRRFQPNTAQSPEWNRGAYLAEALAHCGECHTPRNLALRLTTEVNSAARSMDGTPSTSPLTKEPASAPGATTSCAATYRRATHRAVAQQRAQWAKPLIKASVK